MAENQPFGDFSQIEFPQTERSNGFELARFAQSESAF